MRARFPVERHFRNSSTVDYNLFHQVYVFGRINPVVTAGKDGTGACVEDARRAVVLDPARETGHDRKARHRRHHAPCDRRILRRQRRRYASLHRHHRHCQRVEFTAYGNDRWRVINHPQPRRILGSPSATYSTPIARAAFSSAVAFSREQMRGKRAEPPRRARPGRAESASLTPPQKLTRSWKVRGPDIVAAYEAQPVQSLFVVQSASNYSVLPRNRWEHYNRS